MLSQHLRFHIKQWRMVFNNRGIEKRRFSPFSMAFTKRQRGPHSRSRRGTSLAENEWQKRNGINRKITSILRMDAGDLHYATLFTSSSISKFASARFNFNL